MQNSQNSPAELLGARTHLFVRAGRRGKPNWVPVLVPLGFCGACLPVDHVCLLSSRKRLQLCVRVQKGSNVTCAVGTPPRRAPGNPNARKSDVQV